MYADDICCFTPSLQKIIDVCVNYVKLYNIVINCTKTKAMYFPNS